MRRVVITGMGVVTPLGIDLESFWSGLREGRSGVKNISQFASEQYPCQIAAEVNKIPVSDWGKNFRRVDLMARAAAEQAWRRAGGQKISAGRRAGLGLSLGWENQESSGEIPAIVPKLPLAIGAEEFRNRFNIKGPLLTCFSACAAGTHLVEESVRSIRMGETDMVLAGASDSRIHPLGLWGYARLGALNIQFNHRPSQGSRPFDRNRCGFVMGEGAGFVVLEERDRASKRGVEILAEILGAASTCDAFSLTAPNADGAVAARSITRCLERSGIKPEALDYINAHGTSTLANDAAEARALEKALGDSAVKIPVGSFKSMLGHLSMAAGMVEIIGTVLAMKHGVLPPNLNLDEPEFKLNFTGPRSTEKSIKYALKTSFGFGGQNSSILLASP